MTDPKLGFVWERYSEPDPVNCTCLFCKREYLEVAWCYDEQTLSICDACRFTGSHDVFSSTPGLNRGWIYDQPGVWLTNSPSGRAYSAMKHLWLAIRRIERAANER